MELGSVSYFSPFLFLFLSHLCMGLSVEFSLSVDLLCRGGRVKWTRWTRQITYSLSELYGSTHT